MSDFSAVLVKLESLGVTLDHVRETGEDTRREVRENAAIFDKEMKVFETRMRGVEDKATTIKGMWLAIVVASTMLGIAGTVTGIVVGVSRLQAQASGQHTSGP